MSAVSKIAERAKLCRWLQTRRSQQKAVLDVFPRGDDDFPRDVARMLITSKMSF